MTFKEEREAREKKKARIAAYFKKNLAEIPYGISSAAGQVVSGIKAANKATSVGHYAWGNTENYETNRLQRRALIEAKDAAEEKYPNPKQAEARKDFINNYLKENVGDKSWAVQAIHDKSELPSWAYKSEEDVPEFKARKDDYAPVEIYSGRGEVSAARDITDIASDSLRSEKKFSKAYQPAVKKQIQANEAYVANVAAMTPKIAGLQSDFAGIQSGVDKLKASQQQRNIDIAEIQKKNEEQLSRLNVLNTHPWESKAPAIKVDSGFGKLPLEQQIARAGKPLTSEQNAAAEASGRAKIEAEFPTEKPKAKYVAPVRTQESLETSRQERPTNVYGEYYKRQAMAQAGKSGRSITDEPSDILVN